jgi:hypothetical protein
VIVLLVFVVAMLAAMLAGLALRRRLPQHHTADDSEQAVLRAVSIVVTMAALVLGFVVSSAQSYYQAVESDFTDIAANVERLDAVLARLGPDAAEPRRQLRVALGSAVRKLWPGHSTPLPGGGGGGMSEIGAVGDAVAALPAGDARRNALLQQAAGLSTSIEADAYKLMQLRQGRSQQALLVVILSWLVIVYLGFGLLSPRTSTAIVAMVASATAAAGAMFLVVELSSPLEGIVHIPPSVLESALAPDPAN